MRVLIGVVYTTKNSGPRTEPWGTPQEKVCQEDRSVSHFTRKQRDDRYDLNQLRTEPWMPNQDERRVIKMSWSIASKAAERSSRQRRRQRYEFLRMRKITWSVKGDLKCTIAVVHDDVDVPYWTSKVEHVVAFTAIFSNICTAHAQKRLFMNFRCKFRHHRSIRRPRFPIRVQNFGDLATFYVNFCI